MADTTQILLAGFGGQGVLFSGKLIAYACLYEGKEVTWFPSYGPEMRGGTANCSVVVSDVPVGSPIVTAPDILVAMNQPSLEKFEDSVVPGGMILLDSTLIPLEVERTDVRVFRVPATDLSNSQGLDGIANIILMGKFFHEAGLTGPQAVEKALAYCVPKKKAHLLEFNRKALALGASQ